ncbi:leucyl aminopeptidase family protein [Paenibacillus sp. N3.4]|uniref:M17 family metallopeptidase n=1 Tax=Paenibacillus sp. N3.4 TaxID=2603222 RepID=UPI0011C7903F|nr:leucyl aminopeptidase family protein [Paenibacillus sp. N3.4]TXK81434.1 leucyl aminopeptidase family protein [Paenibacillus sp. N3.4]
MRITIDTVEPEQILIYPVYQGESFPHRLSESHKQAGTVTWLYGRSEGEADVLAAGLGERKKLTLEKVRRAGGASARALLREDRSGSGTLVRHASPTGDDSKVAAAEWLQAWVEGWLLGLYRFDKYRNATKISREVDLNLRLEDWKELSQVELEAVVDSARNRAEGTMLARDWVNESPETLNPDAFVDWIIDHFKDKPVGVQVYRGQDLVDRGMNGLIAVGAGSKYAPALVELRYESNTELPLLALVGKAVTFDMGGMNVKTGSDISDARMDMGGAAAVIGCLDILVRQRAQVRVTALIAVADNLPDARAMLPSSVIRYPNGLTVQVANTDGEGRLVLADALIHAAKLGAAQAIDIATLTGNVGAALGLGIAGIWGDEDITRSLVEIGERNGERLWPMPLMEEYEAELRSNYADLRNVSTSTLAGAIIAALFIRRFVAEAMGWVHIDMAGTVQFKQDVGYAEAGATGYGARLLADYAVQYARKHESGEREVSL